MTSTPEPEQHTLAHGDDALHYVSQGNPQHELIIFLHPAFGDHRCFAPQLAAFAASYRVLAPDMPGHGRSQVRGSSAKLSDLPSLFPKLLAREGHQQAHVVGVSLGALLAQAIAAQHPDAVATLTVVGGFPIFGTSKAIQRQQRAEMLRWIGLVLFSMPRFRRYVARQATWQPQAQEAFYQSAQSFTRRSFQAMAGVDSIMRPAYEPFSQPLHIICGQHERPLLHDVAATWQQQQPGSVYHVIEDAGHCANMDNPAAFNNLLLGWLTTAAARA
ncbi:MAG: alpha/beta hydrolase [Chloroflexaceae bacterium]|nr:alpha/beta hydrolase [Chloroflexaceae bacterium]